MEFSRKLVGKDCPTVAPIDSYIWGHRGSNSTRAKALGTINRGRCTDPAELRHWVVQQTDPAEKYSRWPIRVHSLFVRDYKQQTHGLVLL